MKIVRKNNKYCTIKEENLNTTVIGNPTISDDYIVSNFSASNKLGLPITLDPSQPYEIQIKFKLNYLNDRNGLIGVSTSGIFCVRVFSDNTLNFLLGNTINDFNIGNISGNTVLSSNIDYWTKCVFTGTSYAIYLSTNGINWNLENSINSSTPANNGNPLTLYLGDVHSGNWYLKGSMDLKECYIKSNNNIVWQGVEKKYYGINDGSQRYIPVDYIQGTGPQWIDTEIYPDDTTIVQSKFVMTNYSGGTFIGRGTGSEADSFRFFRYNNSTYLDYGSGNDYNRIYGSFITSTSSIYEAEFGNRYVKDLSTGTTKFSSSTVSFSEKSYTIRIFDTNNYGIIYYLKIKKQGVWVRDFIPVYDTVTQKYGLYDNISGTFFGNSGTGDLKGYKTVILYQPALNGTEPITTMSNQNSPTITNNTLTGYTSSGNGGSGYLSEGWDNTGLWKLTFKGRLNTPSSGIILVCDSTQRDYNLINLARKDFYRYNGSSSTTFSYSPTLYSDTMHDITITKTDSTTIKIKVDSGSEVTISGFTPLSQTDKCYIGVDSWSTGSSNYAIISDIKVVKLDALVSLNKVGSLTINDGVVSGFSSSNYLESTDNISLGSNFELYTEFTTGYMDPNQEYQVVFSGKTNQLINYGTQYRASYGSYLQYNVGNGSSWLVSDDYKFGSHSISSYTKYYVKLTFNGSVYKSYISTDGQTWEQDWSYTTSQVVPSMKSLFGVGRSLSQAWLGSININTAYVILNGIKYTFII